MKLKTLSRIDKAMTLTFLSSGKVDYLHQLQNLCNIAGIDVELNIDKL